MFSTFRVSFSFPASLVFLYPIVTILLAIEGFVQLLWKSHLLYLLPLFWSCFNCQLFLSLWLPRTWFFSPLFFRKLLFPQSSFLWKSFQEFISHDIAPKQLFVRPQNLIGETELCFLYGWIVWVWSCCFVAVFLIVDSQGHSSLLNATEWPEKPIKTFTLSTISYKAVYITFFPIISEHFIINITAVLVAGSMAYSKLIALFYS